MSEQGVQDGTEHPPLRNPCVEDQRGRCVVIYLRKFRIQLQRELFCPMVLRLVISFEGTLAMLGIFFTTHSAVLIEDVPFNEEDMHSENVTHTRWRHAHGFGYSCFITVGIYMLVAALFLPDQTEQAQGVHGALIPPAGLGMLLLQHSKTLSGEEEWLFT
uniref:Uncharacterized protein n=1 Tax=Oncorhynchus kisutch TaxID=8019 RepID=A0A8C7CYS6_ONCKI